MNILVVSNYQLCSDLSSSFIHQQAAAYAAMGHHVTVLIPIALGRRNCDGKRILRPVTIKRDGVFLQYLPFLSLSNLGNNGFNRRSLLFFAKAWYLRARSNLAPNIIHSHSLSNTAALGIWLKERLGVPLVVTTHGSDTSIPVEQGRGGELKLLCDRADRVVAVSSVLAEKVRSCGTETPVSVILNGFNLRALPERPEKSGVTILQAGHLLEQKRFHVTIRSFARIRSAHPEATLTLIGEGPKRKELESLCRELCLDGFVRFTGQIPNPDVLKEMGGGRFFVMPSVREGFGIVYLEAMASGCVTVGTEGEGIADLIVSGKNGFLVPPDDPEAIVRVVEWCLEHPAEADAIAEQGRLNALELTWERNADQYIKLFKELQHGNYDRKQVD